MPDPIRSEETDNRTHALCLYTNWDRTSPNLRRCENCPGPGRTPDFHQRCCPLDSLGYAFRPPLTAFGKIEVPIDPKSLASSSRTPAQHDEEDPVLDQISSQVAGYTRAPEHFLLDGSEDVKEHLKNKAERIFQDLEPENEPRFIHYSLRSSLNIPSDLDMFNLRVDNKVQEYRPAGNMSICVPGPEVLMVGQGVRACYEGLHVRNDPEEQNLLEMDMDVEEF